MFKGLNSNSSQECDTTTIDFVAILNGKEVRVNQIPGDALLVDVLHHELGLTGTKFSCGVGACSACKVAARKPDGNWISVLGCYARVSSLNGMEIKTVEGLQSEDGKICDFQEEFLRTNSFQCGFSTPGMLMAAFLLAERMKDSPILESELEEVVGSAISGHICRCTGYARYHRAICEVIRKRVEDGALEWLDPRDVADQSPPPLRFAVRKRSQNDASVEVVHGRVDELAIDVHELSANDPSKLSLDLRFALSAIRTGIEVRDLNLQKFFFAPYEKAVIKLTEIRPVSRSEFGGPELYPVRVLGLLRLEGNEKTRSTKIDVTGLANPSEKGKGIRLQSAEPLHLDLTELRLPVIDFATEFGIHLDAVVDIYFDFDVN